MLAIFGKNTEYLISPKEQKTHFSSNSDPSSDTLFTHIYRVKL